MADRPGPGVVAVSGGADSVALLCVLHALACPLTVAHVNHGLRGAESDADEAFVRELAKALGIECRVKSVDVAGLSGNLESAARRVRYAFFADVAAEVGAKWVATGHTADDQAETVLHRIVRGTGIQGLRGIASNASGVWGLESGVEQLDPTSRTLSDTGHQTPDARQLILVRPLLTVTRGDVLDYLADLKQPYRDDSSNADPRFTRNRIRHELLPLLRTFNPDVVTALARLAEHANEAHAIITEYATQVLAKAERPRAGDAIILNIADLGPSAAVVRAVLRLVWEREGWPTDQMDAAAWDRACAVARRELPAWDFPGGISMRHAGWVVQIGPRK